MTFNILLLALTLLIGLAHPGRILVIPLPVKSHTFYVNAAAEELPARGHEVYTVQPSYFEEPKHLTQLGFKVLKYTVPEGGLTLNSDEVKEELKQRVLGTKSRWTTNLMSQAMFEECNYVLEENFREHLRSFQFDIILVDGSLLLPCYFLIPHILKIPFISVSGLVPWFASRTPLLPSFCPIPLTESTDQMTFKERLLNFVFTISFELELIRYLPAAANMSSLLHKHTDDPDITHWRDLISKSSLYFSNRGPLLDWPMPSMPNIFYLEGLTARQAKPLSSEIQNLVEGTTGIIIVSFGSAFDRLPGPIVKVFMEAFAQRPELFLFRLTLDRDDKTKIPSNVKLMSWLPQNDLLGHPKAKLFITHCGNNGQYEALYHGIPMIGFPLGADQQHNSARMVAHGYGLRGNLKTVTSSEILDKISEVLTDKSYKERIEKASQVLRSRPMSARETAAYWIDHVLEFGSGHLRSHALDMPLYQYLMLDIMAVVITIICLLLFLIYSLIKIVVKYFIGSPEGKLKIS